MRCGTVFFGCCLVGAGTSSPPFLFREGVAEPVLLAFTLLLPEVAGRDPDVILAEELREKKLQQRR